MAILPTKAKTIQQTLQHSARLKNLAECIIYPEISKKLNICFYNISTG